jgi:DNA integrity scanning protein DisA with diadenylate cyclase activity
MGVGKLLVQTDEFEDLGAVGKLRTGEHVIWLTRDPSAVVPQRGEGDLIVEIPDMPLSRLGQVKIGLFLAVIQQFIGLEENVVCLSGIAGSRQIDMLLVTNPRREFPWFRRHVLKSAREVVGAREFPRLLDIALRLAAEGREGKPIGALFVLGNVDQVAPYLRQLILNPFAGHPADRRSIHDPEFLETLREFAALDGAFVIDSYGVVESAGTYIDAPTLTTDLHQGFGARHAAAAGITAATSAVAVVVSQSSGNVTVFHKGQAILELEQPKPGWSLHA